MYEAETTSCTPSGTSFSKGSQWRPMGLCRSETPSMKMASRRDASLECFTAACISFGSRNRRSLYALGTRHSSRHFLAMARHRCWRTVTRLLEGSETPTKYEMVTISSRSSPVSLKNARRASRAHRAISVVSPPPSRPSTTITLGFPSLMRCTSVFSYCGRM